MTRSPDAGFRITNQEAVRMLLATFDRHEDQADDVLKASVCPKSLAIALSYLASDLLEFLTVETGRSPVDLISRTTIGRLM